MKLLTFDVGRGPRAGLLIQDRVVDIHAASGGALPGDMLSLLAEEPGLVSVRQLERRMAGAACDGQTVLPLDRTPLLAPVPRPGKVICLGLNYRDHAAESGMPVPAEPVIFGKVSSSVIGPGAPIVLPEASAKVDYEVELAFVIGRRAKLVKAADAMAHVAGYTVLNDVSARDYQRDKPGGQWYLAKSFDTFCPIGPWIVTPDEAPDARDLKLWCEVSGERLQSSSTAQMIFSVPQIVEYISRVFTLEPGDVVATGTPPGVGFARRPPRFLRRGDIVRCTVEGVGTLENPVV
jgi:2-keto-4-pentenoate hydratase/2-oxohepta-3-ene-1,7-dioic acid hydratase in catechol pathway